MSTEPSTPRPENLSAIARRLGISRQRVWGWFQPGSRIPAEWVIGVETASGISRHELRPDIYPPDVKPQPQGPAPSEPFPLPPSGVYSP